MMTLLQKGGYLTAAIVAVGLSITGCSDEFLEEPIPGTLSPSELTSAAALEGVLIGTYSQLSGAEGTEPNVFQNRFGGAYNWVSGSIQGGEANKGTEPGDGVEINQVVEYNLNPTSSVPQSKFRGLYRGVASANQTIILAVNSEDRSVTDDIRDNIIGQALFLRSHYYFQLAMHFQRFPYYDEEVSIAETVEVPNEDNMQRVMDDMKRAVSLLPETQDAVGKVNVWAAKAYLGKMQLHAGLWEDAKATLTDVIENGVNSNGVKYALLANFSDNFNAQFDNNAESIFAIQAAANTGSIANANAPFDLAHFNNTSIGGCCGFFQPSFDLVDSYRTTDNGLPLVDGSYRDPANRVKSDLNVESGSAFTPDAGNLDPRLDHSVGRRGIPFLDWGIHPGKQWIRLQENGGPYSPIKVIYRQSQSGTLQDGSSWTGGYTAINFNVIRFADVLLMAAEANAQLDDLETAQELVNQVRERAMNISDYVITDDGQPAANYVIGTYDETWSDMATALQAIYFERKLELSNEGHRFFDLVRWGIAEEYLNSYVAYESLFIQAPFLGAKFTSPQDLHFPIPQSQIDLQRGVLTQNVGY